MKILLSLVAFACGLVAGTEVMRWTLANQPSQTGGMLEHLEAYGGDYDVIVVGSSFTKVNFLPKEFDQHMAELGHPVTSFGLGMKGMRGAEIHYYVERILDLHLPKLKWILCDVSLDQNMLLDPAAGFQRRTIEWHHWPQFLLILPPVLALLVNDGESFQPALLIGAVFVLWTVRTLRSVWMEPRNVPRAVGGLLAGICWVDLLAVVDQPREMGIVFAGCFVLALVLQKFVPAT